MTELVTQQGVQRVIGLQSHTGAERHIRSLGQGLADMAAQVEEGIYNAEPRTPQSTSPATFRQWREEVLKPS